MFFTYKHLHMLANLIRKYTKVRVASLLYLCIYYVSKRINEPYSQHFIFFISFERVQKVSAFVPGRLFQPSLIFASKEWARKTLAFLANFKLGCKSLLEQTL
jgi:hypothetical protein